MKHHLFVENKYYNWYVNIILNARKRNVEDNVYYEIPSTTIITLCKKYSNTPMKKKSKWAPKGIPLS